MILWLCRSVLNSKRFFLRPLKKNWEPWKRWLSCRVVPSFSLVIVLRLRRQLDCLTYSVKWWRVGSTHPVYIAVVNSSLPVFLVPVLKGLNSFIMAKVFVRFSRLFYLFASLFPTWLLLEMIVVLTTLNIVKRCTVPKLVLASFTMWTPLAPCRRTGYTIHIDTRSACQGKENF